MVSAEVVVQVVNWRYIEEDVAVILAEFTRT
jgi:hypothetical protein